MIEETETDHLDQSLRDKFSDYELTPSRQLWAGIEGRLPAAPPPVRSLPLLPLLPLAALVGVGVGWLLPHPQAQQAAPTRPATEAAPPAARPAVVAAAPLLLPAQPVAPVAAEIATVPPSAPASRRVAAQARTQRVAAPSGPAVVATETLASAPETDLPATEAGVAPEVAAAPPQPSGPAETAALAAVAAAPQAAATAPATDSHNSEEGGAATITRRLEHERRPELRVPTHRTAERGRGLRQRWSHISGFFHRLFGSKRSRTAVQSNF